MIIINIYTFDATKISAPFCVIVFRHSKKRYTHKTSGFKTSGFETFCFKTSETLGLQNVSFTKRQVYKTSGLQNVWLQKNPYIFCTCGWWKSAGSVAATFDVNSFYSLLHGSVLFSILEGFCH
jgi:hypothetical protein